MNNEKSRRSFLKLGLAACGSLGASGSPGGGTDSGKQEKSRKQGTSSSDGKLPQGIDLEKWKRLRGKPYKLGHFGAMPGVCRLPGPQAKRNWPDREKYKGVTKVPGMCQLCSAVCGIVGYVKNGRVIKLEGNPNDPNSRGHLCARGQAGLNHLYHPERLLYPLTQVPLGMVEDGERPARIKPFLKNPSMWLGLAVPFVLHGINALSHYYKFIGSINKFSIIWFLFSFHPFRSRSCPG